MPQSLPTGHKDAVVSPPNSYATCLLDAMPSHIAIMDQFGNIEFVNKAWTDFAKENQWALSGFGVGLNYFDVLNSALESGEQSALDVATGIQNVIQGRNHQFHFEYPCHTPKSELWFAMTVTRFEVDGIQHFLVSHQNITERKSSELHYQGKEQLLRSVYDSSSDAIILLADNSVFDCNAKAIQMFGFASIEEFLKLHPVDLSPFHQPDGVESRIKAEAHMQRAMEHGEARFDWIHRRKDGNLFSAEVLLTYFESQGRHLMQATVRDITYRKEVEEALRRGREDLNIAQRIAHVGSWYWEIESGHMTWSDELYEMYGCDPKWPPPPFAEQQSLFTEESYQRMHSAIEQTMESGVQFELELEMVSKEDQSKWIWFRGELVNDTCGVRVGMRGVAQDISERKKAEEAREEALARLEKIASRLPGVVYQFRIRPDGSFCFPYASQRLYDIHGVTPEEVREDGSKALDFHHPEDSDGLMSAIQKSVMDLSPWKHEFRLKFPDGTIRWLAGNSVPEREADGSTLFHGYFEDVTEQVGSQQKLLEAHAAAKSANRAKSEFLANMSHEIRTPMTAILGYAEILAEGQSNGLPQETQSDCIDTIKRNGEHLLSIINDILDISKIEADKLTAECIDTSPLHVAQDVIELMKVKAEAKGIEVSLSIATPIPETIQSDPTRLRQILVNLVGNAIKFTELGSVTIVIRMEDMTSPSIFFDVIDTGIGITEAQINKLFQSFEQADASTTRKFGGTGLGLRISKRLAQILGGDIEVTSKPGCGSTFTTCISTGSLDGIHWIQCTPESMHRITERCNQETAASESATEPESQLPLNGLRILLAEDGPDNQRLISFHLGRAGAIVDVVDNGKYAVEWLTVDGTISSELRWPNRTDLILMDMQMPEMDGYEATEMLRSKGCKIPILALTAHAMDVDLDRCIDAGCDMRLTKPIDRAALIKACQEMGKQPSAS